MKQITLSIVAFLVFTLSLSAQKTFYTKSGYIGFFSSTPLENIDARNNQVVSFLKTADGSLNFGLLVKSFKFKNALMEEHFNENYAESDKYPKAKFKGKILNLNDIDFDKNGTYIANIEGKLTFHGVTNKIKLNNVKLIVSGDKLKGKVSFKVKPEDYKIEIPAVVKGKIAKEITIKVEIDYSIYKK
ncbi:MAG TPA: YceI family protein [Bacteroidetes bacterium]|nr:YceI family protein [Bacteroidota bacterium]